MASTFVNDLRLEEMGTGEQAGTWGSTTNTNLELIAEAFSYGSEAVANASTHTITVADGATDEARSFYLKLTGGGQACTVTFAPNTLSKVWLVENATSATLTLSQGSGANVAVLAGEVKMIATDGGGSDAIVYDLLTDVNLAGTTAINALKLGGTTVTSTAAELNILDGVTSTAAELNYNDTGAAVGTVVASKTVTVDANKDVASFRNITLTGELDAGSLDVSGDADIDGTLEADAITIGGTAIGSLFGVVAGSSSIVTTGALNSGSITSGFGNVDVGSSNLTATGTISLGATSFNDNNITNVGSIALDTIINDGTDVTIDSSGDIILDADSANVIFKDGGTSILDISNVSSDAVLTVSTADKNLTIKGTDGAGAITALDIDMALAGKATFNGDVVVGGDLTISGDDLTMATNTSGALLIADGTNFNPTVVGDLSEISTVANDDVFMAIDTSGGGLKKISRSAIIAGLASSGAISNVVDDSTPQLGGNLDLNGADIVTTSNATLDLAPNGTGTVVVRGNDNSGAVVFNCESNSHGQKVYGQPHSAGVTNTLMLPAGANSTLVSLVSTDTLTNKTLTSPKINEDVAVTSTATELNLLDGVTATTAELNVLDGITAVVGELNALDIGSTAVGTAVASKAVILDSNKDYTGIRNFTITGNLSVAGTTTTVNTVTMEAENAIVFEGATADAHETTLTIVDPTADRTINLPNQSGTVPVLAAASNTAVTSTPEELNILDGVTSTAAELNILDGVTSTAAELNILDGVTTTAAEINLIDGDTARGTTAVASGDGILINDAGTMRMTNVDTVSTYFSSHNVGGGNIVTTGALNSGSITSGFGAINNGSSAITTTGTINFGSLADGTITVTAFVDEDDMSTNSATLVPTQQSVKAYVDSSVASAATKGFAIAMAIVFG